MNPAGDLLSNAFGPGGRTADLLVATASENSARELESHLRNAGFNVHTSWIKSRKQLEERLAAPAPDMVLCADDLAELPAETATTLILQAYPGLPVLWLTENVQAESRAAALQHGARDLCSTADAVDLAHFELVLLRELTASRQRLELAKLQSRLTDTEAQSLQLLSAMPDAIAYVQEGIVTRVNPAFAKLVQAEDEESLAGRPLMDFVAEDQRKVIRQHLKHVTQGKLESETVTFSLVDGAGNLVEVHSRWKQTSLGGEPAIELSLRQETQQIQSSGGSDSVGVASAPQGRLAFIKALELTCREPTPTPRILMFVVVDDFGSLEDRLGLQSAEEAVLELLHFIQNHLHDIVGISRFSTDEIALIVNSTPQVEVEKLITRMCKDISTEILRTAQHEAHVTVTLLAFSLGQESTESALNDVCREARKLSKQGGNRAQLLGPAAKTSLIERELERLAAQLKKALAENRMTLAYQAIASLEGDARQHQDVLVRMVDEDGKELLAADFISAAEKHSLIRSVDQWVTTQILKLLAERRQSTEAPSMFVRLSEETLRHSDEFLSWLKPRLQSRPLKPEELIFEMQEGFLHKHVTKANAFSEACRKLGIQISISRFGAAANSEQILDRIPAQYVKFDPQFTQRFADPNTQKRMTQLLAFTKAKGIKTICSHIEDANLMAKLWQLGINYIQGRRIKEPEVLKLT